MSKVKNALLNTFLAMANLSTPQVEEAGTLKKRAGGRNIKPGHTMFQYNVVTCELTLADFFDDVVDVGEEIYKPIADNHHKIKMQPNCIYVAALNRKNALKRAVKLYEKVKIKMQNGEVKS